VNEIVILSGKGGTGKTSLTAAFAHLSSGHVVCDLDVDAPDLHLLLRPQKNRSESFFSGHEAVILDDKCEDCGTCADVCQFDAISQYQGYLRVDPMKCEGCKVCVEMCPADAIDFPEKLCGEWYLSQSRFGPMVHAQLFPGEENSGRLVALLRQQAKALAKAEGLEFILSDGPPGIGCPVISSLSGASLAVIVTEPTPSGLHDLERVTELCAHFGVPTGVIINKHDLNGSIARDIEIHCRGRGIALLGQLPHDPVITMAMISGEPITQFQADGFSMRVREIWKNILELAQITTECV
jgi:MinD superfamily P-loop ATPase